ncbi:MAG: DUF1963 domain-containing protein [Alistipes sp.]|nr:DUF1963 domain-containing protein [Candidatus Alistipes equi]
MAIELKFLKTEEDLTGKSKWWGFPDLPEDVDYPELRLEDGYSDPLTFICQIRCEDIAPYDTLGLLPKEGMLWFFAALDYFLGDMDAESNPGMGEWRESYFRVLYSRNIENLHTHKILYDDGQVAVMPAEKLSFAHCDDYNYNIRLLGQPYLDEIKEHYPNYVSLLQIDGNDDWNLRFYDCGMLCMLLEEEDLKNCRFQNTKCYLHSF